MIEREIYISSKANGILSPFTSDESYGDSYSKTSKVDNCKIYGLKNAIKVSGYPMKTSTSDDFYFTPKESDTDRAKKLGTAKSGSGHDNFLKGIVVQFDLTFSNKAWVELQRYHFIDFISSQSTMHRIAKFDLNSQYNQYVDGRIIEIMNELKDKYNDTQDKEDYLKLLYSNPAGFMLTAGMTTNYQQLKTMYNQRKNHRLPEWREFCEWIEILPMFKELCLGACDDNT